VPIEASAGLPSARDWTRFPTNRSSGCCRTSKKSGDFALRASGGNRAKAAEKLGVGAATLYRKLKQARP
jgi:DNA-binding NtrC family response regulator